MTHMVNLELKILMLQNGITYKAIANKLNVSAHTVRVVACGAAVSKRIREALAESVGKTVEDLWPAKEEKKPCINKQ
jgi:orotate phosphoribosyltransferase-like protein